MQPHICICQSEGGGLVEDLLSAWCRHLPCLIYSLRLRSALRSVVACCSALARYMEEQGPRKAMDVDELLLRESMDVIGRALPPLLTSRAPIRELPASQRT